MTNPMFKASSSERHMATAQESTIGRMLLNMGKITLEDTERISRYQKEQGMRFGDAAQQLGYVTESDIKRALALQFDYPYLQEGKGNFSPELVAAYQPFSIEVENLRVLRSHLLLRWFAEGHKTLTIAGFELDNRRGMLLANLAVLFSQLGEKTLLVDANLRNPNQHKIFNLKPLQGLSDILAGRAGQECILDVEPFGSLSVLPAGTAAPNPQELLNRPILRQLNRSLEQEFDIILYDAPPFLITADVLQIASLTRGVMIVAKKNCTRLSDIITTKEQLTRLQVTIVGSVLNDS